MSDCGRTEEAMMLTQAVAFAARPWIGGDLFVKMLEISLL
jgi:hypothetical protein